MKQDQVFRPSLGFPFGTELNIDVWRGFIEIFVWNHPARF